MEDKNNNYLLYSDFIKYLRNDQKIFSENNSKAIDLNDNTEISAQDFKYDLKNNIVEANKNVKLENKIENYTIYSQSVTYFKEEEKLLPKVKLKR